MNKEEIIALITKGYSQREIASELNVSQTNLRYWLNKFNIKTKKQKFNRGGNFDIISNLKKCPKCNKIKNHNEFYPNRGSKRKLKIGGYCKSCNNLYTVERLRKIKEKMIQYKGGSCERCNLIADNKNYCVFDFHHNNPIEKDINFSRIKYQSWKVIQKEIDKCSLLCSNCHRITHSELIYSSLTQLE